MKYLGGKYRIRKRVGNFLNSIREQQIYWEPFVGSAWVTTQIDKGNGLVLASDANPALITMWNKLQDGWIPPESVSEEEYYRVRDSDGVDPALKAFVGFGASWGGKWYGGYARDPKTDRNYAREAKSSLLSKLESLKHVVFFEYDFLRSVMPVTDWLIYCDPPYAGTTMGYGDLVGEWNITLFWERVRYYRSKGNTIVVSEYNAPDDFECVKEFKTKTDLNTKNGKDDRTERLFM